MASPRTGRSLRLHPKKPIDPELLRRARLPRGAPGRLTRRSATNAEERRAVDRSAYEVRRGDRTAGESVRSRLGHGAADRSMRGFIIGPEIVRFDGLSRQDARRLGRYWSQIAAAFGERGSEAKRQDFARRVRHWAPLAGQRLLWDPASIEVLLAEAAALGIELPGYIRGRR